MNFTVALCYPRADSRHFAASASSAVAIWCRDVRATSLHAHCAEKLRAEGWIAHRFIDDAVVTRDDYGPDDDGLERLRQAELDGFVASVFHTEREAIGGHRLPDSAQLVRAARELAKGAAHLAHADGSWAVGVTPRGNDFTPLLPSMAAAARWRGIWPGSAPCALGKRDLLDGALERIEREERFVALLARPGQLVTASAIWLAAELGGT